MAVEWLKAALRRGVDRTFGDCPHTQVFQYYDIASKKVDVNFEDITNDIRFKYYLRFANLIGHFKEVDFVNILKIFETIREVALSTAKFGTFFSVQIRYVFV